MSTINSTYTILFYFLIVIFESTNSHSQSHDGDYENNTAVKNLRDYLRINTAFPKPDYGTAISWIKDQANILGLEYNIVRFSSNENEFTIWLTWEGKYPELPSVFLYSHIDVVAVDSEWSHDPFSAEMDSAGNIYGRGAQDMKSVGVQYLEAIRNLKGKGIVPGRTIHIGFFPDEERGGDTGIILFIDTLQFQSLNVGFALDEGMPNEDESTFSVYYAQRTLHWIKFTAYGKSGHGSLLLNDTAGEKIRRVINKLLDLRETQVHLLEQDSSLSIGDVMSINLNVLEGGIQTNIIPPKLSATFDIRFPPTWTSDEIIKLMNDTCEEAGANVTYDVIHSTVRPQVAYTKLDNSSWWWNNFQIAFEKMNITLTPKVFSASTDGEVLRRLGIPTIGFSPIFNTTMLFHDRDEYLNVHVFLRGIEIYETLIESLAHVHVPTTTTSNPQDQPINNHAHGSSTKSPTKTKDQKKGSSGSGTLVPFGFELSLIILISHCFYYVKL